MRNCRIAILASLAVHAVVAAALILYFEYAPSPDVLVQLDLSSMELSSAETVTETAPAVASAASQPSAPAQSESVSPPKIEPTPEVKRQDDVEPIEPEPVQLREPEAPVVNMRTPPPPPKPPAPPEPPKPTLLPKPAKPAPPSPPSAASPASAASAPRQARLDAPPKPRRNIKPDYPREARQRGEQGDVRLEISVGVDGLVLDVRIISSSGFADLDESAVAAVRKARFTPAKSDGHSVASTARITLTFKLK